MRKSRTSGSYVHIGERMGAGHAAGTKEVGGMNPGKHGKFAVKNYFEGGKNSYSAKGMKTQNPRDED